MQHFRRRLMLGAAAVTAVLGGIGALIATPLSASAQVTSAHHVYVLNNTTPTNSISVYDRDSAGRLTYATTTTIGGSGAGVGLGSQGSLILADDHLFAVDAGSNQFSVVDARHNALTLDSVVASHGVDPISLTYSHGRLYVLNSGDATHAANVSGFWIKDGKATLIQGANQPLSAASPNPAEVQTSPDGNALVVTEKGTNILDVYHINHDGSLGAPTTVASVGTEPFGFAFNPASDEQVVVSEAASNALTAYTLAQGTLQATSGPVADQQVAPCWVIVTSNGRYVYTANAGSGTISGFRSDGGHLSPLNANGVTGVTGANSHPLELALSDGSHYLFALDSGTHTVSVFAVQHAGSLSNVAQQGVTLPASAVGLAAD